MRRLWRPQAFVPRGANRAVPEASKITEAAVIRERHRKHRLALRSGRARVDNRWGADTRRWNGQGDFLLQESYDHIRRNLKGAKLREERNAEIVRENTRVGRARG